MAFLNPMYRNAVIHTFGSLSNVSNIINSVATSPTDSCDSSRVIISLCFLRHHAAQFSPAQLFILSSHYLLYLACLSSCKSFQFSLQDFIVCSCSLVFGRIWLMSAVAAVHIVAILLGSTSPKKGGMCYKRTCAKLKLRYRVIFDAVSWATRVHEWGFGNVDLTSDGRNTSRCSPVCRIVVSRASPNAACECWNVMDLMHHWLAWVQTRCMSVILPWALKC